MIVVNPNGKSASLDSTGRATGLAKSLLELGHPVLLPDLFMMGENARPDAAAKRVYFDQPEGKAKYFTTYNRTDVQERVQDLITACAVAKKDLGARKVVLAGVGRAGLCVLLAAPAADGVTADCAGVNATDDTALLAQDIFTPGLKRMGGFAGVASLAAPNPALIYNVSTLYAGELLRASYSVSKDADKLRVEKIPLDDATVATWITGRFGR